MNGLQKQQGYDDIIEEIADDLLGYVGMEIPEECEYCASQINDSVRSLLNFDKPKVMVYGIYNSGKSTLINALMKQEVAEMADRPMTDQISEFDRGEYVLVDSPGIDAPIQHEMVTEEFLNKCHIILFVISSKGGFEGLYNYQKGYPFCYCLKRTGVCHKARMEFSGKNLKKGGTRSRIKKRPI